MRSFLLSLLVGSSLAVSGCSHVARDLRHPGGTVGGVLDKRMFDASGSKDLVLLRGAILIAMVARAGTVYSRDQKEADAYVDYISNAAEEINIIAGHIRAPTDAENSGYACTVPNARVLPVSKERMPNEARSTIPDVGQTALLVPPDKPNADGCYTYASNFESDLPLLERRTFRLAMAALPQDQAKKFLDQVTKGNTLGAAMAAFSFAVKALDGLHTGAAVHRTGLELVARQHKICIANNDFATVYEAANCMGLPTDELFVGRHDTRGNYELRVSSAAFHALMRNLRDSCRMIPLGIDDANKDLNAERTARINQCNEITFQPKSRWATAS